MMTKIMSARQRCRLRQGGRTNGRRLEAWLEIAFEGVSRFSRRQGRDGEGAHQPEGRGSGKCT